MFDLEAKRKRAAGEEGFTLIELLVVIIILGILAAVVVFAVGGAGDKGQIAACKIDTRTLRTALEAYSAQPTPVGGGGNYTADEGLLVTKGFLSEPSTLHTVILKDPDGAGPFTATQGFDVTVESLACNTATPKVTGGKVGTNGTYPGTAPAPGTEPENF